VHNQPFSDIHGENERSFPGDNPRRRPWLLGLAIVAVLVGIGLRVAYMQAIVAELYLVPWQEQIVEEEPIPCRNGRILSRDGVVLAQDESRYDLSVDYRWLQSPPDPVWLKRQVSQQLPVSLRRDPERRSAIEQGLRHQQSELVQNLATVTGNSPAKIRSKMAAIQKRIETMLASVERKQAARNETRQKSVSADWSTGLSGIWKTVVQELTTAPDRYADDPIILKEELQDHLVVQNVSLKTAAAIQSQPSRFPGVHVRAASNRSYPHASVAAHVIGLRKPASPDSSDSFPPTEGQSGVERVQNKMLAGIPGMKQLERGRHAAIQKETEIRPPVDGKDVVLTLDFHLQQLAEELLDETTQPSRGTSDLETIPEGATLVAMDIWTGDLLVLACTPRPSLNILAQPTQEQWAELQANSRHPLFPRITQLAVAPGALFKVITAAAALQEKKTDPVETLTCRGFLDSPDQYRCPIFKYHGMGHGAMTLEEALAVNCQVHFHELGRRLDPETLCHWAGRFGLGQQTGIDLPGEASGQLPDLQRQTVSGTKKKWYPGSTLQLAVGQGALLVTPLQMVRLFAAIANGGYLVRPHVMMSAVGDELTADSSSPRIPGLSEETLTVLQAGLERSVQDPNGSAHAIQIPLLSMAGLAGSAEIHNRPAHVWFAGYAPARQPRIAFALVLEHGGSEIVAAELMRNFVVELLGGGYLRPFHTDPRQIPNAMWQGSIDAPPSPIESMQ